MFISRLLNFLRSMPLKLDQPVRIPQEVYKDISWWIKFMPTFNGVSIINDSKWLAPDSIFSTDACLSGGGGFFQGLFFHVPFPEFVVNEAVSINNLKLFTVRLALKCGLTN